MFLALREFRHAKMRYALITLVIAMVASLVFILSALANGLAAGSSEAVEAIHADSFAVATGSEYSLDRSRISPETAQAIVAANGVSDAQPFTTVVGSVHKLDETELIGVSVIGITPDTFLEPGVVSGESLRDRPDGIVIDQSLANRGVKIGDTLIFEPGGIGLAVVGITDGHQYRLAPTLFVSLDEITNLQPDLNGNVSAVAIRGENLDTLPDHVDGIQMASAHDIVEHLPGYTEQNMTLTLIQLFLVVIAALVIAAFFFILTLQKMQELGVMKALGATTWTLARALMIQSLILAAIGILIGIVVGDSLWYAAEGVVPYKVQWQQMLTYSALLLLVAIVGTLLSLIRIARVDPLDAINRAN